ncbi:MAG: hypothetical protein Q7S29_06500 [Candidatus Peribacter sp.]|nr:hypothetical protein [Candidatus Peribacter sp.]
MGKLTVGDVLRLIETSPIVSLATGEAGNAQTQSGQPHTPAEAALLQRMISEKVVSVQTVQTLIESSRVVALEAVRKSLTDFPSNQPLDEIQLARIQSALESQSAVVRRNRSTFQRINPKHSEAVLSVSSLVSVQLSRAIADAMRSRTSSAGTAS